MQRLSSRQNPIVKEFRALAAKRAISESRVLLDGAHLIDEALGAGVRIATVAVAERLLQDRADLKRLATRLETAGARVFTVTEPVMFAVSPVRTPSGIVAIGDTRSASLDDAFARQPQLVVFLDQVQDPGNVGAIARAADAAGATGIITGPGTADPFGWKALRGSMGSTFRVPTCTRIEPEPAVNVARAQRLRILATSPHDGEAMHAVDLSAPTMIVFGGEGSGLQSDIAAFADARISIPMRRPVESLNVAVAAGVLLYEAFRQRRSSGG